MDMHDSVILENPSKIRRIAAGRHAWQMALAGVALAVSLATGCKQQTSVQQPAARTDQQINSDILAKIQGESALAGQNIQVSVNNGVATLSGTVSDDASRALAGNDSGTVNGVRTVVNNLAVQPQVQASAVPSQIATPVTAPRKENRRDRQAQRRANTAPQPQPAMQAQPAPVESAPPAPVQAAAAPPPPPAPPKPVVRQVTLDQGTVLPVILTEDLTSKTAQPDDVFHATLATDLVSDGAVVVPRGSAVLGRVTDVKEAAHFKGNSLLMIELTQLSARGRKITLVTDAYSKTGEGRGKNTLAKSGGGAALGAIIGAIAGGGKGAAIGAVAGGGAGAGVNAVTRGQQAEIPSETRLEFRLQSPITVAVTTGGRMEYERNGDPQLQQR